MTIGIVVAERFLSEAIFEKKHVKNRQKRKNVESFGEKKLFKIHRVSKNKIFFLNSIK